MCQYILFVTVESVTGLTNTSVFPGQSANWSCQVSSTIPLQFMWYINGTLVFNETGSHMDNTASSSYTLNNVNYTDDGSNVNCSAAGSVLEVNSSIVYLTGKSLWSTFRSCKMRTPDCLDNTQLATKKSPNISTGKQYIICVHK